jgi:hypothetical protein
MLCVVLILKRIPFFFSNTSFFKYIRSTSTSSEEGVLADLLDDLGRDQVAQHAAADLDVPPDVGHAVPRVGAAREHLEVRGVQLVLVRDLRVVVRLVEAGLVHPLDRVPGLLDGVRPEVDLPGFVIRIRNTSQ